MVREYLAGVEVRIERGAAGGLPSLPDPAKLVEAFREGGLAALVQTKEQRALMERVQAAMAVVEGYSEHVMDALGERGDPRPRRPARGDGRAAGAAARRPSALIQRLLGLDMKMRQYELGKRVLRRRGGSGGDRGARPGLGRPRTRCRARTSSSTRRTGWPACGPAPAAAA